MLESRRRNDLTEGLLEETVDLLDALECRADATSWDKADCYTTQYEKLRREMEFKSLDGQKLTRAVNQRLFAVAEARNKRLSAKSFYYNALRVRRVFPEIYTVDSRHLPYDHYMQIAACSLPREDKNRIRTHAERSWLSQQALRKIIRQEVDAYNGIYKPDFELKVSNFWKFTSPHDNNGYGGIHPEVVANLLFWFTEPNDVVIDPMAGSGVLADTLTKYRFFRETYQAEGSGPRLAFMSDLEPSRPDIACADASQALPFKLECARFAILDPPYLRIADGKRYRNIGNNIDLWLASLTSIIRNVVKCLAPNGALAVISDDVLRKDEHIPLAFRITQIISAAGLLPTATIYNHTPNFVFSMGPAQMKAARTARLMVNHCKVIQVAKRRPET